MRLLGTRESIYVMFLTVCAISKYVFNQAFFVETLLFQYGAAY